MTVKKASVNKSMCDGSPVCPAKRVCPQKAITQKSSGGFLSKLFGGGTAEVNRLLCTGCGKCVQYCPHHAISMGK
jgi:Fe-S-cluster-containing hydrogenase component 2